MKYLIKIAFCFDIFYIKSRLIDAKTKKNEKKFWIKPFKQKIYFNDFFSYNRNFQHYEKMCLK